MAPSRQKYPTCAPVFQSHCSDNKHCSDSRRWSCTKVFSSSDCRGKTGDTYVKRLFFDVISSSFDCSQMSVSFYSWEGNRELSVRCST